MSRKSDFRVVDYLQHILDAITRIDSYILDRSPDEFADSFMIQGAVIRNLEVIGEAAINIRSIDPATAASYPEWDQICGMRNRLTHGYFDINIDLIWRTAQKDLPPFCRHIQSILGR
jgi:uncharacterized protein with HEPN domain